jgi:hypothetical protein
MASPTSTTDYARRHLRFGWWSLLAFAAFGLLLESLQGFKVGAYLDVTNETRRTLWRLAHAHGTLLSVLHVLFGLNVRTATDKVLMNARLISFTLTGASLLVPGGFFLGGFGFKGGDPGLAVLLVPVGAVLLFFALFWLGAAASRQNRAKPARPREQ